MSIINPKTPVIQDNDNLNLHMVKQEKRYFRVSENSANHGIYNFIKFENTIQEIALLKFTNDSPRSIKIPSFNFEKRRKRWL